MSPATFDNFLKPNSVAIIGASPQRGTPRNTLVRNLQKHGFAGPIYPVSPSHAEIEGLTAYKTVADLPEVPDVAMVITPAETVPGLIAECGAKGVRNAIVFSSGFEETENGKDVAKRLAQAARDHGVALLGPNCQGIWSVRRKALLTFSPAALNRDELLHSPIAIISQSGAIAGAIANALQNNRLGCSYIVSVGNETCIDALEALSAVIEQDDVRVVALYVEGLDDASRIFPIAERARANGVQIIVLKAGRSAAGQQATASHTGKIASSHAVYADVLEQAGILMVDGLQEVITAMEVLAFLPHPRVSGDALGGISIMSSSGGAGALLADHASEFNLPMSSFSADTVERLHEILPAFASKANPIDLTGQVTSDKDLFRRTCEVLAADPRTEAAVVQFAGSGQRHMKEDGEAFKVLAGQVPTVISFVADNMAPSVRREFLEAGAYLSSDPAATMNVLSLLYRRQRALTVPALPHRAPLPQRAAPADWASTMAYLEESGVTPARWLVLAPEDRAEKACAGLRYPLVVKVLPSDSEHKTELGLVKLRVRTAQDVDAIAQEFRQKMGKPLAGILVQEMADDGVEVVLSCLRNTDFGPVLAIGSGGVAVELYRDVVNIALPTTQAHVINALRKLKLWTLLQGFRGKPAADVDAFAEAAVRFGDMFLAASSVSEFEVNPVIVLPEGQGLVAVDALVTVEPA